MGIRTEVVEYAYECERCGSIFKVPSHDPVDMPEGYHLHIRRVTAAHSHSQGGPLFFCSKDCLVDGLKWQASSLMAPVDSAAG